MTWNFGEIIFIMICMCGKSFGIFRELLSGCVFGRLTQDFDWVFDLVRFGQKFGQEWAKHAQQQYNIDAWLTLIWNKTIIAERISNNSTYQKNLLLQRKSNNSSTIYKDVHKSSHKSFLKSFFTNLFSSIIGIVFNIVL